jgi:ribosome-associated heat shock protein Hsp15
MSETAPETARLDVWLWRARFFKTRALAAKAVTKRGVRITRFQQTRRTDKPGASVAVGDTLTFTRGSHIEIVEVAGLGHRRGPASEAQGLYVRRGDEDV